ncbi:MAG: DUF1501 domain-containing protein, partial [Verrucomicrobiales bacterium]
MNIPHYERLTNRRDFLKRAGGGFGALAAAGVLGNTGLMSALGNQGSVVNPLQPKVPKLPGTAKRVIFLFMEGGPSHLDICDPKPLLNKLAGQKLPESFGKVVTAMGEADAPLLGTKREFKQHGESGLWFSDWVPHMAEMADDWSVIKSCVADGINHAGGVCQMNTGSIIGGRPSLGSWVSYGLGNENQNLPSFVVLKDTDAQVINGVRNWGSGFMPAVYQGTLLDDGPEPFRHLNRRKGSTAERQQAKLDFLGDLNRSHMKGREEFTDLDARIKSMELAFRMQAHAPEAVDLSQESEVTKKLYGMDEKHTANFGRMCLLGRRLAERGVRFIQLYHGAGSKWDSHSNMESNHSRLCAAVDKPVAGLLKDLKARGMLDETLVIWGGEFGRTPMSEKGDGRDHNPTGFSMLWAGGGVKGGQSIGQTDELGLHAI